MDRPTVFCQMEFMNKFLNNIKFSFDNVLLEDENLGNILSATYKLIYGRTNLHLDIHDSVLLDIENPMIKKLVKSPTTLIKCNPNLQKEFNDTSFWENTDDELFLLDDNEPLAETIEKDWGLMVLTPGKIKSKGRSLTARPPLFITQSDEKFSFDRLMFAKHIFHKVVLVDNYFNANERDIKNNIIPLLKTISSGAPKKRPLKLTVITTDDNITDIHKILVRNLSNQFPRIEVTVAKTQTLRNHDRHLITNQLWITSGFGFNILSYNNHKKCLTVVRDTTIVVYPRISNENTIYNSEQSPDYSWSYFSSSSNLLKRLGEIVKNASEDRGNQKWLVT